mmetsp:Transcript_7596/g.27055  ORF Transcript_7596/g.27055 Transcript_7596/m.27055 type:complete len:222 (-) Transcript_7596:270-935(-)
MLLQRRCVFEYVATHATLNTSTMVRLNVVMQRLSRRELAATTTNVAHMTQQWLPRVPVSGLLVQGEVGGESESLGTPGTHVFERESDAVNCLCVSREVVAQLEGLGAVVGDSANKRPVVSVGSNVSRKITASLEGTAASRLITSEGRFRRHGTQHSIASSSDGTTQNIRTAAAGTAAATSATRAWRRRVHSGIDGRRFRRRRRLSLRCRGRAASLTCGFRR